VTTDPPADSPPFAEVGITTEPGPLLQVEVEKAVKSASGDDYPGRAMARIPRQHALRKVDGVHTRYLPVAVTPLFNSGCRFPGRRVSSTKRARKRPRASPPVATFSLYCPIAVMLGGPGRR
jgi:hypothetical protein